MTGNRYSSITLEDLYGSETQAHGALSKVLTENPDISHLFEVTGWTRDFFVRNYTSYHYIAPFRMFNGALNRSADSVVGQVGGELDVFCPPKCWTRYFRDSFGLRLCIECIKDDLIVYGIPYWHRCHQLPGVRVCHIHGRWLVNQCSKCKRQFSQDSNFDLPSTVCKCGAELNERYEEAVGKDLSRHRRFSVISAGPIIYKTLPFKKKNINMFYANLSRKGLTKTTNNESALNIARQLCSYYGNSFMEKIFSKKLSLEKLFSIVHRQFLFAPLPPIWHILIIGAYFKTFIDFLDKYSLFIATNKLTEDNVIIHANNKSCAMTPKNNMTIPDARAILKNMLAINPSLRRGEFKSRCSRANQILSYIDTDWYDKKLPPRGRWGNIKYNLRYPVASSIEGDRKILEEFLSTRTRVGYSEFGYHYPSVYMRMMLRDREWLKERMGVVPSPQQERFDIMTRKEDAIIKEIGIAVERIISLPGCPVRITVGKICSMIGIPHGKTRRPNIREAINKIIDSNETYWSRRCDWAILQLQLDGISITTNSLKQYSGMPLVNKNLLPLFKRKVEQAKNAG